MLNKLKKQPQVKVAQKKLQTFINSTKSESKYDNIETYSNCFTSSLCDDPRDTYYIMLGAMAYDADN